jgi:hypothetical protein
MEIVGVGNGDDVRVVLLTVDELCSLFDGAALGGESSVLFELFASSCNVGQDVFCSRYLSLHPF